MKVTDPVCGMQIDAERAAGKLEFAGVTYWFCAQVCRKLFAAEPARYVHLVAVEQERRHDG